MLEAVKICENSISHNFSQGKKWYDVTYLGCQFLLSPWLEKQ